MEARVPPPLPPGASPMPDIITDLPVPSCYSPVLRMQTGQYQWVSSDLFSSRAYARGSEPGRVRALAKLGCSTSAEISRDSDLIYHVADYRAINRRLGF